MTIARALLPWFLVALVVAGFAVLLFVGLHHNYDEGVKQAHDYNACLLRARDPRTCDR